MKEATGEWNLLARMDDSIKESLGAKEGRGFRVPIIVRAEVCDDDPGAAKGFPQQRKGCSQGLSALLPIGTVPGTQSFPGVFDLLQCWDAMPGGQRSPVLLWDDVPEHPSAVRSPKTTKGSRRTARRRSSYLYIKPTLWWHTERKAHVVSATCGSTRRGNNHEMLGLPEEKQITE